MEQEFGLRVAWPTEEARSATRPEIDVVFVHGLNGGRDTTWTARDQKEPWFQNPDFLQSLKNKIRVMTFGYNANLFKHVAVNNINDHANDLLEKLVVRRRNITDRPLIFVCHSLGGLVVKEALILSLHDQRYKNIREMTSAIIFLGTPHEGSDHASPMASLEKMANWATWRSNASTELTKELQTYSSTTRRINRTFMREPSRNIELVCFYETVETRLPHGTALIVPQQSAEIDGNGARNISMSCNHQDLCKFARPDSRFQDLWDQLDVVIENASRRIEVVTQEEVVEDELQNRLSELSGIDPPSRLPSS